MVIYFGALAPPLAEQLTGTGISTKAIEHAEEHRKAILRLSVHGYLPKATTDRLFRRLLKWLESEQRRARRAAPSSDGEGG